MDDSIVAEAIGGAGTQWLRHRRAAALSIALGTSVLPLWSAPKSDCGNAVDAVLKAYQVSPVLSIVLYSTRPVLYLRCNATSGFSIRASSAQCSAAQRSGYDSIGRHRSTHPGMASTHGVLTQGWIVLTAITPSLPQARCDELQVEVLPIFGARLAEHTVEVRQYGALA